MDSRLGCRVWHAAQVELQSFLSRSVFWTQNALCVGSSVESVQDLLLDSEELRCAEQGVERRKQEARVTKVSLSLNR